ncbi:MAG: hypothetical protein ACOZCO_08620 [Bacteroidota bacterium]
MEHKKLVVALIKDDLINICLVDSLSHLIGMEAGDYFLHASDTIFELMGFEKGDYSDEVHEEYFRLTRAVKPAYVKENKEKLDEMALEIYSFLKRRRLKKK